MKDFWYTVFEGDREAMEKVDEPTVQQVELTAPGVCRSDAQRLHILLQSGQIFGAFSVQDREKIWNRVCAGSTNCLIPSFSGFFNDMNWLKGPVDCVTRLMILSPRETVISALEKRLFSETNQNAEQYLIQESEDEYTPRPGNQEDRIAFGVRQVFLSAIRHFLEIPAQQKKKNLLAKPRSMPVATVLSDFANHAHKLGFESDEIRSLRHPSTLLPQPEAEVGLSDIEELDTVPNRSGIPLLSHHKQDKTLLFVEKLHRPVETLDQMTSFFVRRSVYFAFLGQTTRTVVNGSIPSHHTVSSERGQEMLQKEGYKDQSALVQEALQEQDRRHQQRLLEQEREYQARLQEQETQYQQRLLDQQNRQQEKLETVRRAQDNLQKQEHENQHKLLERERDERKPIEISFSQSSNSIENAYNPSLISQEMLKVNFQEGSARGNGKEKLIPVEKANDQFICQQDKSTRLNYSGVIKQQKISTKEKRVKRATQGRLITKEAGLAEEAQLAGKLDKPR